MMSTFMLIALLFLNVTLASAERFLTESNSTSTTTHNPNLPKVTPIVMTFAEFKSTYGKQYSSTSEENYRTHIFNSNLRKLNNHNANSSRTFNMKANAFLDVSGSQFKQTFTGTYKSDGHSKNVSAAYIHKKRKNRKQHSAIKNISIANQSALPLPVTSFDSSMNATETIIFQNSSTRLLTALQDNQSALLLSSELSNQSAKALSVNSGSVALKLDIDWSVYTGSIKYQGLCGACYAFSSADTFAAVNAINKYSFYVPLSVQQIIDCVDNGLTFGCSGGYLEGAFTYIQMNGINIEQTYPYASMNSGKAGKCKQEGGPFKLSSFNSIQEGDCNGVLKSLALGPVSAGIAGYKLQFYDTGIFNDCNTVLDHAVVIVGYRSGVGWRIKNSWGTEWGQQGYGWIAQGNTCGICNMAVSVSV